MLIIRLLVALMLLAGVAFALLWSGMRAAEFTGQMTRLRVERALAGAELDWAQARVDGLVVTLDGQAPDRFARELARESVARAVPASEVIDSMALRVDRAAPPEAAVEVLRSGDGITLSGAVAGEAMHRGLRNALSTHAPRLTVTDLLETDARMPPGAVAPGLALAARAAALLPEARLTWRPGRVTVSATVDSAERMRTVSERLRATAPEATRLTLDLSVPQPVIAPFQVVVEKTPEDGLAVSACAARSRPEAIWLSRELRLRGAAAPGCRSGLGGPSGDWDRAVAAGLAALDTVPAGRFDLSYRDAALSLPASVTANGRAAAEAALTRGLPVGYRAHLSPVPRDDVAAAATPEGQPWLHLTRGQNGAVVAGRIPDPAEPSRIETLAAARFGQDRLRVSLSRSGTADTPGWDAAAAAAVEALARLDAGEVTLTPGQIRLTGRLDEPAGIGRLQRDLEAALPDHAVLSRITVDVPGAMARVAPSPARCASMLNAVMARRAVGFAPGSAVIDADGPAILDAAARILRRCPEARLEIGGHTDSQGSADFNARLSRARAETVLAALTDRGIAWRRLSARGYGETRPIADNDTEDGRRRNRRIVFRPLEGPS